MKNNFAPLLIMLLITEILLFGHFYTAQAAIATATQLTDNDIMFIPEISIGGIFQKTGVAVNGSTLGNYINTFYLWAIRAVAILAVFMLMLAGIRWITANGNASTIGAAKSQMTDAIVGLLLILCANLILNTINPALTTFQPIQVQPVAKIDFETDTEEGQLGNATAPGSSGAVSGQCFPIQQSDFNYISWNWGNRRDDGGRCHAGIDIFTSGDGKVVAVADGKVVNKYHFYHCNGGEAWALLVAHDGYVVNYGELDESSITVDIGDNVKAGQYLGNADVCYASSDESGPPMLHFELYTSGTTENHAWYSSERRNRWH